MKLYHKMVALTALVIFGAVFAISGCSKTPSANSKGTSTETQKLKVGVTAGPHEQVLEEVKRLAALQNLDVEVVVFNDYILPNLALSQGDVDLNSYQHEPFLNQFNIDRKTDLSNIGLTINFPMGIYSKQIKDIAEVKSATTKAKANLQIGIPNDPTNGGRALLLLESAGIIKVTPGLGVKATVRDIIDNPYNVKIIELEASQIYQHLDELVCATINTNFAIAAGLVPTRDSIFIETAQSPYVNLVAARTQDKDKPIYQKFLSIYRSPEVKAFIAKTFEGSVIASW